MKRQLHYAATAVAFVALAPCATAGESTASTARYELVRDGDRVSVSVNDLPLAAVATELGREFGFEVIAELPDSVTVSADFRDLSLADAVHELCRHVGYVEVRDPAHTRIVRLVLTSARPGWKNRMAARRDPLSASLPSPERIRVTTPDESAPDDAQPGEATQPGDPLDPQPSRDDDE